MKSHHLLWLVAAVVAVYLWNPSLFSKMTKRIENAGKNTVGPTGGPAQNLTHSDHPAAGSAY